mmetsp:Transcript_14429/g.30028  ORF Transcript_14429/g.30028 Transcript_14429/m.30028 type:complete len:144 (+) Transcript_14429:1170-1601(+)
MSFPSTKPKVMLTGIILKQERSETKITEKFACGYTETQFLSLSAKKFLDGVLNLALQPAEFVLSTPLGQGAQEALGPMLVASKQLLMPALLSSKLAWITLRSMALAGLSGMTAAGTAFLNEGTSSLTEDGRRRPNENRMVRYI